MHRQDLRREERTRFLALQLQAEQGTFKAMNVVLILQLLAYLRHRWLPKALFLVSVTCSVCSCADSSAQVRHNLERTCQYPPSHPRRAS